MDCTSPPLNSVPPKKTLSAARFELRRQKPPPRPRRRPSRRPPSSTFTPTEPPPTDPSQIELIWSAVNKMASSLPRTARGGRRGSSAGSGRRRRAAANMPETDGDALVQQQQQPISPPLSSMQALSVADSATSRTTVTRAAGPRSPRFRETVLSPCGIHINRAAKITPDAHAHFGTRPPPDCDYRKLDGLQRAAVWLSLGQEETRDMVEEYKEMHMRQLCEEEFADYAKETLLRSQRRARRADEDGLWRVERLVQAVCLPDDSCYWQTPPVLDPAGTGSAAWSWDVRPDCSYWLSLDGFNTDYSFQIEARTYVKSQSICPYFTIEFKRTGESDEIAINQVAAAGAMALYNRFCLYRTTVEENSPGWRPTPTEYLRHYGLTFVGPVYTIWVLRARVAEDGTWNGCVMEKLISANCGASVVPVRHLTTWINEIHRWGLTVHGLYCKDEIKALLSSASVRISDFSDVGS